MGKGRHKGHNRVDQYLEIRKRGERVEAVTSGRFGVFGMHGNHAGQMAAGGKAHDPDLKRVKAVFCGKVSAETHAPLGIQQGNRPSSGAVAVFEHSGGNPMCT